MGGLVTLAGPNSLPAGASPRCHDNDYSVGSTHTRDGLTSVCTYSGAAVGPSSGGSAVDTATGSVAWANPSNVLANDLNYATAATNAVVSVTSVDVTFPGQYGNSTPPTPIFSGTGSGAVGHCVMVFEAAFHWHVGSVVIDSGGSYTGAVTVSFSGGYVFSTATGNVNTTSPILLTDAIDITHFGFSVPSTSSPQGFEIEVIGYTSIFATLNVQMLKAGVPVGAVQALSLNAAGPTIIAFGGANDLFGAGWAYSDLNNTSFGVRISGVSTTSTNMFVGYVTLKAFLLPSQTNFDFITPFTDQNGTLKNILLDATGNLWIEDVTNNPRVLTLAVTGIAANSYAVGAQGEGVEYLAFNDGTAGCDLPRQYTSQWIDRITQVGPGAAPVFTPIISSSNTFAIATITQPAQKSDPGIPGHFEDIQWSSGPTSTTSGNVITIFYALASSFSQDATLANAFNSGQAVYVYMSGLPSPFVNGTYQVTSVGKALPPGGSGVRWYFTYQVTTSAYVHIGGPGTGTGFYQQTLATMTTSVAVPGLTVGAQVTVSSSSVAGYNNTWPITQTLNSGAMAITSTAVTSGVATYTYSLSSGVAPVAGQLVTITGTNNANGGLNLVNVPIVTATGGGTGSFTIAVSLPNASSAPEGGQAVSAGTIFAFDPGFLTLGTITSPIYGNGAGGTLTFTGVGQFVGSGTRQGTVFFITRNGYYTAPAPPVTFACPANTTGISASQIPIGPPNVIKRGIVFTEAGQNGVPGANFFTIPTDVQYTVNNVSYTANALIINDNTTTQMQFFFTDSILLAAQAIDIYGYNLFNQIELGNPGWIVNYDSRNFYGLCQNKIQNFNNLSFDGGFISSISPLPIGWTSPDVYGSLLVSPVFGNSYYIRNTSGGMLAIAGLIQQTAYQDAYQQPIINANTDYSVRITARVPSGSTVGALQVDLYDSGAGVSYGISSIPFGSLGSNFKTFTLTIMSARTTIPAGLLLRVYAAGIGAGADVEIDRNEVFPTNIPNLATTVYGSYAGLPEQVDAVTGQGKFISENQQPVNGAVVLYDTLYGLKGQGPNASMYSWQSSPNLEPSDWAEPEVAQHAGGCGPMAFDFGEQWFVEACRNGLYLYEGGQPGKIMQEIFQVWDAINWSAEKTIWVKNDVTGRRLFVGVPMATPNFWLPNALANPNPQTPNVILMCNYQGLDTGSEIKAGPQMHTTMFGTLNAIDMRRKWSIWQIASPYGASVQTQTDKAFYICNGASNSKVYMLDPTADTDDGVAIDSLYTTASLPGDAATKQYPQLGDGNYRVGYMNMTASGAGLLNVRFLPNTLLGPTDSTVGYNPWTVPGGFTLTAQPLWNRKASVNFFALRAFVELRGPDFDLSNISLTMTKDVWNSPWGQK